MKKSILSFLLSCFLSSLVLLGCGDYRWTPLIQCSTPTDCPNNQRCVQSVCKKALPEAQCSVKADCAKDEDCIAQKCTPTPSQEPGTSTEHINKADAGEESQSPERPTSPEHSTTTDGGVVAEKEPGESLPEVITRGETHTSPNGPLSGCLQGSTRVCMYKSGSQDAKACKQGLQTCLFDGSWSDCKTDAQVYYDWFTSESRKGEICGDGIDNNCNGQDDEGCYEPFRTDCYKNRHVPHTKSYEEWLLHPAFLSGLAYSAQRKILLQKGGTVGSMSLYQVDTTNHKKKKMFEFPPLGDHLVSYHINADGTRVAASTSKHVFVWLLEYDSNNQPKVTQYGVYPIKNVYLIGVHKDGKLLVTYQQSYDSQTKKTTSIVTTWDLKVENTGQLTLALHKTTLTAKPDYYFFQNSGHIALHPSGKYVVLHSYNTVLAYSLPSLELLAQIDLGSPVDPEERKVVFHPTKPLFLIAPVNYASIVSIDMTLDASGKPKGTVDKKQYAASLSSLPSVWGFDAQTGELYGTGYSSYVYKWTKPSGTTPVEPVLIDASVTKFAMDTKQGIVYGGSYQGFIKAISTKDGSEIYRWSTNADPKQPSNILHMNLLADGKTLLVAKPDAVTLWTLPVGGGKLIVKKAQILQQGLGITYKNKHAMTSSEDGSYIAFSIDDTIHIWNKIADGSYTKKATFTSHKGKVLSMGFQGKNEFLVSGDDQGQLWLWPLDKLNAGTLIHTFTRTNSTYPASVLGTTFFGNTNHTTQFILATTQESKTFAFSIDLSTPSTPVLKKVDGEVEVALKGSLSKVKYEKGGYIVLLGSSSTYDLVKRGFTITNPDAQGKRTFKIAGSLLRLDDKHNYKAIPTQDFASARDKGYFATFTSTNIYFWHCQH